MLPISQDVNRALISDPDRSVTAGENRGNPRAEQTLCHRITDDRRVPKHIEAALSNNPKVTLAVFIKGAYSVARQSIRSGVVVSYPIVNPVKTVVFRSNPQRVMPINMDSVRSDGGPIKTRNNKRTPFPARKVAHATLWSNGIDRYPNRTGGAAGELLNIHSCFALPPNFIKASCGRTRPPAA